MAGEGVAHCNNILENIRPLWYANSQLALIISGQKGPFFMAKIEIIEILNKSKLLKIEILEMLVKRRNLPGQTR